MAGADQQVRPGSGKVFHGGREEREEMAVILFHAGEGLQPGGVDGMAPDDVRYGGGIMDEGIDRSGREGLAKDIENAFSAAHAGKPVMAEHGVQC
jgi:hypothetical protein